MPELDVEFDAKVGASGAFTGADDGAVVEGGDGEIVAGLGRMISTKRPHPVPLVGGSVTLIGIDVGKVVGTTVGGPEGVSDSAAVGFPVGAAEEGTADGLAPPDSPNVVSDGEADGGGADGAALCPPVGTAVIDGDAVGAGVGSRLSTPAS